MLSYMYKMSFLKFDVRIRQKNKLLKGAIALMWLQWINAATCHNYVVRDTHKYLGWHLVVRCHSVSCTNDYCCYCSNECLVVCTAGWNTVVSLGRWGGACWAQFQESGDDYRSGSVTSPPFTFLHSPHINPLPNSRLICWPTISFDGTRLVHVWVGTKFTTSDVAVDHV